MTTLIFVRHGQSETNLQKIFAGQGDPRLTELGHRQAERTAEYLRNYPITHIYASDLQRTMDTAAPTAKMHGLDIIPDRALREINAGKWEGKHYEEIKQQYPETHSVWTENVGMAWPDGGERVIDLYERVNAEVERLIALHRGECIALFSHATPARALGCRWLGIPPEEMAKVPWTTNASVSIVEYEDDGRFRVVKYGYDGHQGDCVTAIPNGVV